MKTIRYRSGMPYILCGLVVLLYALVFGLGSVLGYAGALLLAYLVYAPIARLFPDRYVVVEDFPTSKDAAVNALIQECASSMRALRAAGDVIYDPWLLEKVDIIAIGYRGLLRALSENPALLDALGKYLKYLLPNTVMLLNVRVKLQDRQLDADKVNTRRRIDEALIAVEQSLEKQLALLEQRQPLQVEEDIQYLKNMLGQSGVLQPEGVDIPVESPAVLIAEQLAARRQALLQLLQDRVAAMLAEPDVETEEEPSVYAAEAATAAPALVVPAAPEPPGELQPLSASDVLARAGENMDYLAARKQLIAILDESLEKMEGQAQQEPKPAEDAAEAVVVSEPVSLEGLAADTPPVFSTQNAEAEAQQGEQPLGKASDAPELETGERTEEQVASVAFSAVPEEMPDVESIEHIPEDAARRVESFDQKQTESESVVEKSVISDDSTPPAEALPQAGNWFSMEGFEDEDDVPVYQQAAPPSWVPPETGPETMAAEAWEAGEPAVAAGESPVAAQEGTDVPSVMDFSEESVLSAWMEAPAMQAAEPVARLQETMRHAMASVRNGLQIGQTDYLSGRDYLAEIGKQFAVALEQSRSAALSEASQADAELPTFQAPILPARARAQRNRMTSQQIEEMVLGDILRSQGLQDVQWQEPDQETLARKRKPRMEIDKSVLMALLGHDGNESAYLQ